MRHLCSKPVAFMLSFEGFGVDCGKVESFQALCSCPATFPCLVVLTGSVGMQYALTSLNAFVCDSPFDVCGTYKLQAVWLV